MTNNPAQGSPQTSPPTVPPTAAPTGSPTVVPYGSWSSPVSAQSLTEHTVGLTEPRIDGDDLYWLEGRASEGGRVVVVRRTPDGSVRDVTAAPYNVRSRVHEYGGGAYDVAGSVVVFCNFDDRRVYRVDLRAGGPPTPRAITPASDLRYGDLVLEAGGRRLFAVCEDHSGPGEARNRLVMLDAGADADNAEGGTTLVEGPDFVAFPTPSPDGSTFAWMQWSHPAMPWDESQICVAELRDGRISRGRVVAGTPGESVTQPSWAPDGRLFFVSDRSGWSNLYAAEVGNAGVGKAGDGAAEPVALRTDDHDFAGPQWALGSRSYGVGSDGIVVCTWLDSGYARISTLDPASGTFREVESDVTAVRDLRVDGSTALLVAGYADKPAAVVRIDLSAPEESEILRRSSEATLDPSYISRPEPVSWDGPAGEVFGFYYPPTNSVHRGPDGELPPLLVGSHGGPTAMSPPTFDAATQYWTTRGLAVLNVNYGGSSGYGRAYRERLRGAWGIVDVADCAGGATAMAERGKADPQRLGIRGGSAGGYTTLAALAFTDVFSCGASYFGVGDLEALARDTHKFESRYLDGLVGPYPERADLYRQRSPVHHVDGLSCPLILLQGSEDRVVPPNQAETMAAALRARGLPVALLMFDGEGHGFRKAENVIRATEAEVYFYSRVFGFELAEPFEPVEIYNLPIRPPDV